MDILGFIGFIYLCFITFMVVSGQWAIPPVTKKGIQAKKSAKEFIGMSEGAKHLLSIRDPSTESGYYKEIGSTCSSINTRENIYSKYSHSPLETWAKFDYESSQGDLKKLNSKKEILSKKRLQKYADRENFDLLSITSEEWDLILQRYIWHLGELHFNATKVDSILSSASERNKGALDKMAYLDDAIREIASSHLYQVKDLSEDSWVNEFDGLNKGTVDSVNNTVEDR